MKKLLLFVILFGSQVVYSMQQPQAVAPAHLSLSIQFNDYEQVKNLLYGNDFTQNQIENALTIAQVARHNTLPGEERRLKELDKIINLLKAFINFSARNAQLKRRQT